MSIVSVVKVEKDVLASVKEAMELLEWKKYIPEGSKVVLKPNLCWDLPLPGAQTSPWVFEGVILTVKDWVSEIIVVESNQITVNADKALRRTGIERICKKYGLQFLNLSKGQFRRLKLENGFVLKEVDLPEVLFDYLLITIPVLKTHGTTVITGALKNQWGCLKELRHNYHLVVDEAIADLNSLIKPRFCVMDGTIGMEGSGPKTGVPRVSDLVLASSDPVALDTVASRIMGFDPEQISHIRLSAEKGIGTNDFGEIQVKGTEVLGLNLRFKKPEQNFMVKMEFFLRNSRFKKVAFESPLLGFLGFGAKIWNSIWYLFVGRRFRRNVLKNSWYGAQWKVRE